MNRYRLTFDANPKELARREAGGSHVALLWSRRLHRAAVVVDDLGNLATDFDFNRKPLPRLVLPLHPAFG